MKQSYTTLPAKKVEEMASRGLLIIQKVREHRTEKYLRAFVERESKRGFLSRLLRKPLRTVEEARAYFEDPKAGPSFGDGMDYYEAKSWAVYDENALAQILRLARAGGDTVLVSREDYDTLDFFAKYLDGPQA